MALARCICALVVLLLCFGCATSEPSSISAIDNDQTRKLAVRCYRENEGFQEFLGRARTWSACHEWAYQIVSKRVQNPEP